MHSSHNHLLSQIPWPEIIYATKLHLSPPAAVPLKPPKTNHDLMDPSSIFFLYTIMQTQIYPLLPCQLVLPVAVASPMCSWPLGRRFLLAAAKPVLCPLSGGEAAVPTHVGVHPVTQNKSMFATVAHFLGKLPRYLSPLLSSCCNT